MTKDKMTYGEADVARVADVLVRVPMARLTITKLVTETTEIVPQDGAPNLTFGQIIDLELAIIAKGDGVAHEISLDVDQEIWAAMVPAYKDLDPEAIMRAAERAKPARFK